MNDSGFVTLTRLAASEITGQDGKAGIIEKYFSLSQTDTTCLKDIGLYPEEMRVGDDILLSLIHIFDERNAIDAPAVVLTEYHVNALFL